MVENQVQMFFFILSEDLFETRTFQFITDAKQTFLLAWCLFFQAQTKKIIFHVVYTKTGKNVWNDYVKLNSTVPIEVTTNLQICFEGSPKKTPTQRHKKNTGPKRIYPAAESVHLYHPVKPDDLLTTNVQLDEIWTGQSWNHSRSPFWLKVHPKHPIMHTNKNRFVGRSNRATSIRKQES